MMYIHLRERKMGERKDRTSINTMGEKHYFFNQNMTDIQLRVPY